MVDIQHTTTVLENLASQIGKTGTNTGADRKENEALDSQFDAALEELNKESVSELENALADELVEESENAEMAMMSGDSEVDEDEAFKLNYGINGRESGGDRQQDQQGEKDGDANDAQVDQASHDEFELAVHGGGQHDEEVEESVDSIAAMNSPVDAVTSNRNPDDPTVFDLVPVKKDAGEEPGEETWASEFSLEEIFQDALGEDESNDYEATSAAVVEAASDEASIPFESNRTIPEHQHTAAHLSDQGLENDAGQNHRHGDVA